MLFAIPFPEIGAVLIEIGPFAIRWYALAYIVGLVGGWRYCIWLAKQPPVLVTRLQIDEFLIWATIGVIVGGRLGYVLFYQPGYYLTHPAAILQVWEGGMSFHGGCVGVILALILFARRRKIPVLALCDIVTAAVPIGLFLGRLANFVNAELYGRPTDVPWAFVFPKDKDPSQVARHPSQLYEAGLEGVLLFVLLLVLIRSGGVRRRQGLVTGSFLAGYAMARIFVEFFREPDAFLGFLFEGATMGQLLSLPMLLGGTYLMWRAHHTASRTAP
jgi:phosphatidylglycerol:prolipoprotein diacylglycerol transferase